MREIRFKKMHGLGNCFVLVDDRGGEISGTLDQATLAVAVCDRNFGIGADGLILIKNSDCADFEMKIVNEDGSVAEMCGNGLPGSNASGVRTGNTLSSKYSSAARRCPSSRSS